MAQVINSGNFEALVATGKPVVIDFGQHGVVLASASLPLSRNWQRIMTELLSSANAMWKKTKTCPLALESATSQLLSS